MNSTVIGIAEYHGITVMVIPVNMANDKWYTMYIVENISDHIV